MKCRFVCCSEFCQVSPFRTKGSTESVLPVQFIVVGCYLACKKRFAVSFTYQKSQVLYSSMAGMRCLCCSNNHRVCAPVLSGQSLLINSCTVPVVQCMQYLRKFENYDLLLLYYFYYVINNNFFLRSNISKALCLGPSVLPYPPQTG